MAKKLAVKGLAGFAVSPNTSAPLLAAYVPEGKGAPGFVGIWPLAQLSKGDSPAPVTRRSFFRVRLIFNLWILKFAEVTVHGRVTIFRLQATSAQLLWNAKGTALLALTASDTDATNKSYYGEQKLNYLAADGKNDCVVQLKVESFTENQQSSAIPKMRIKGHGDQGRDSALVRRCSNLSVGDERRGLFSLHVHVQEGPVHDVQWSPSGEHFITVAGFMPAKSTLFTEACKPFFDLGSGGHNLVRWNAQVRVFHL